MNRSGYSYSERFFRAVVEAETRNLDTNLLAVFYNHTLVRLFHFIVFVVFESRWR